MSLFSLLGVARDGLSAQSAGLDVTGQNVANVNTPGYARRQVLLETRALGDLGTVNVAGTLRTVDRFIQSRLVNEDGRRTSADAREGALAALESIISPGQGAVGDRALALINAFQSLSAYPMDPSVRLDVLAKAEAFATSLSETAGQVSQQRDQLLASAQGTAGEVNERLSKIAVLNTKIAEIAASGAPASDLRDQRDVLVREVGQRIGATAVEDASGQMTVLAGGVALVSGDTTASLSVSLDSAGAMQIFATRKGGPPLDITSNVSTGSLGGLLEARDVDLADTQAALDQYAFDFAGAVNGVFTTGFGLDGVSGRPLFAPPAAVAGAAYGLRVDASVKGQPNRIAATSSAASLPGGNDVALSLAALGHQPLGASVQDPAARFASIEASVGIARAGAQAERSLREDTVAQVNELNEAVSGVSLEEEMTNMTKFQRAFEASSRVLRVADELLTDLMRL